MKGAAPVISLARDRPPSSCSLAPGLCPAWHGIQACLFHWTTIGGQGGTVPSWAQNRGHTWNGLDWWVHKLRGVSFCPAPWYPLSQATAQPPFPPVSTGLAS